MDATIKHIRTVGELRELLKDKSDDTPLLVAPTPSVSEWVYEIRSYLARTDDGATVLLLPREAAYDDEVSLKFDLPES